MGLLKRFLGKGASHQESRVFVLGLDGVSYSFAAHAAQSGLMPNLAKLLSEGDLARMNSVIPTVSTVAWANYATGMNPGKHGVFGYVDREPNPFNAYIPTSRDLKAPTIWEMLGRAGKRVGVMNVPLTYPPRPVNGFMVSCFLSPELAKATYPVDLAPRLMEMDYRIDPDLGLARSDLGEFMNDVNETMSRRFSVAFSLMQSEPWEFFQLHEMCTDRVNHFLWGAWEDRDENLAGEFESFYRRLDSYLGELKQHLPPGCRLVMLSDHGTTRAKANVYVNHWLEKNGYLLFPRGKKELRNLHPDSRAYSLAPGRVFINLEGREERGRVPRGAPYEDLRAELIHRLSGLKHPDNGEPLVRRVFKREELYAGAQLGKAADLVIDPMPGYELKPNLDSANLLAPPELSGTHVFEDAFVYIQGMKRLPEDNSFTITDMAPTLLNLMGAAVPQGLDGQSLI